MSFSRSKGVFWLLGVLMVIAPLLRSGKTPSALLVLELLSLVILLLLWWTPGANRKLSWGQVAAVAGLMILAATWAIGGDIGPGTFNGWGLSLSLLSCVGVLGWHLVLKPSLTLKTAAQLARRIEREANFDNFVVAAEEANRRPDRWPDDWQATNLKNR